VYSDRIPIHPLWQFWYSRAHYAADVIGNAASYTSSKLIEVVESFLFSSRHRKVECIDSISFIAKKVINKIKFEQL
jgi:hypothetical protein